MSIETTQKAYDQWSEQYDTNVNRTWDLEAVALREIFDGQHFESILEIGCGTGKNSQWLITKTKKLIGADLSEEMLAKAKAKLSGSGATFVQADITQPWDFTNESFDLITFSLVLEHIENLDHVFSEASKKLRSGGKIYLGELHPFKQYSGSKARFETEQGQTIVPCYTHNISDFTDSALKYGLTLEFVQEFFDDNDRTKIPRILALVFGKRR